MKKEFNLFVLFASLDVCLEYKCAEVKWRIQDEPSFSHRLHKARNTNQMKIYLQPT